MKVFLSSMGLAFFLFSLGSSSVYADISALDRAAARRQYRAASQTSSRRPLPAVRGQSIRTMYGSSASKRSQITRAIINRDMTEVQDLKKTWEAMSRRLLEMQKLDVHPLRFYINGKDIELLEQIISSYGKLTGVVSSYMTTAQRIPLEDLQKKDAARSIAAAEELSKKYDKIMAWIQCTWEKTCSLQ